MCHGNLENTYGHYKNINSFLNQCSQYPLYWALSLYYTYVVFLTSSPKKTTPRTFFEMRYVMHFVHCKGEGGGGGGKGGRRALFPFARLSAAPFLFCSELHTVHTSDRRIIILITLKWFKFCTFLASAILFPKAKYQSSQKLRGGLIIFTWMSNVLTHALCLRRSFVVLPRSC